MMGKKQPKGKSKAAGIILLTKSAPVKFLLMRHKDRWDLPKGHCEPEESYLETALRETQEETGIDPESIEIDPNFEFTIEYPVKYKRWGDKVIQKKVKYFLGRIQKTTKLSLTEHESYEWIEWSPPHEIQKKTIDPLLAALAEHLESS